MNTDELKYSLFTATKTESERYLKLSRTSNNTVEREIARQRYEVLYNLIERSDLEDEYAAWEWQEEE